MTGADALKHVSLHQSEYISGCGSKTYQKIFYSTRGVLEMHLEVTKWTCLHTHTHPLQAINMAL